MNTVLKLNDFHFISKNRLTLIQACLVNKIDIPRFCFHEKLSIAGNCRMCLVEDLKQVKPIAACAINVVSPMTIYTNTLKVKKARESVLEFLLANHPLDCPICDQGGECDLQDQSLVFGSDRGRFYESKRSVEDKDCGPFIKTIMNRCIHCTRCVRFSNEVVGVENLGITGRGSKMEIGFYIDNLLSSELSGNVIDLCPVGALTSKPFAFSTRSWELKTFDSIDVLDELHSNIRVDVRGTKILRILPRANEAVNGDWITDRIRFSYDSFRKQRLLNPTVVVDGKHIKLSWHAAFSFLKKFCDTKSAGLSAYLGSFLDVETLGMIKRFSSLTGSNCFLGRVGGPAKHPILYSFNTDLNQLNSADTCLLCNINLRTQLPIINAKLRSSITKGLSTYLIGYFSNFNYYVKHISLMSNSMLNVSEGLSWLSSKMSKTLAKRPVLYAGAVDSAVLLGIMKNTNLVTNSWNGLNILTTSFFASELCFASNHIQNKNSSSIDWLLNYDDELLSKNNNRIRVYQGHHGDNNAYISNIILPSTAFIEKNSNYINIYGFVQRTKKILFNLGDSRDDWKIINALIEFFRLSKDRYVANSVDLMNKIALVAPIVKYRRNRLTEEKLLHIGAKNFLHFSVFFGNHIFSNQITRNSKTISLSLERFKRDLDNFVEKKLIN